MYSYLNIYLQVIHTVVVDGQHHYHEAKLESCIVLVVLYFHQVMILLAVIFTGKWSAKIPGHPEESG